MIYEYCCVDPDCKFEWESEHRIIDDPETLCPKCKKETAKRLISKCSFMLLGKGWFNSGGY
jgi:putative FmdB family regulatory protein